tara:strand:+ start:298 stop:474 length:177 start_codon:yes stop_codon:yes gene_type:complete
MTQQITLTSQDLYKSQAPMFNFELNEVQLLAKALYAGFVTKIDDDLYLVNEDYEGNTQ